MSKKKNHQSEIFDIQRKIVANMTSESWEQIPHVSYLYEADVTDLLKVYQQVKEILPITIVFDHRALDFGDVVPLIRQMDNYLANPEILQEWRGQDIVRKIEAEEKNNG